MSTADLRGPVGRARWGGVPVPLGGLLVALLAGPVVLLVPTVAAALVVGSALVVLVAVRPVVGAYLLLALTPLIAGMDRGAVLPVLRPSEAIAGVAIAGLLARGAFEVARGAPLRVRATSVDWALLAFAFAGSVIPLLWVVARGKTVSPDDLLYALQLWKYVAVYLIVRVSVRSEAQVRRCLVISIAVACVVGVLAMLQSLGVLGVQALLEALYTPGDETVGVEGLRGTSTLGSSLAVADVMVYTLAIIGAWAVRPGSPRGRLLAAGALCLLGALGAAQFSGYIALAVAVLALGLVTGRAWQFLTWSLLALPFAAAAMWPVIGERLSGFDSNAGLPSSWVGRWENLTTFFWPRLGDFNWLLGVQPSARIAAPESWRDWIWIESGHTWLLWSGGVPFLVAFFVFVWCAMRLAGRASAEREDAVGIAAAAAFTALCVLSVTMVLDPHVTLRGSADLLFGLIALSLVARRAPP